MRERIQKIVQEAIDETAQTISLPKITLNFVEAHPAKGRFIKHLDHQVIAWEAKVCPLNWQPPKIPPSTLSSNKLCGHSEASFVELA